jgi:hypothetical protein
MPYIFRKTRLDLRLPIRDLALEIAAKADENQNNLAGVLNYTITELLLYTHPQSYKEFNALVGMLECCKLEFYRRAVAAYEDEKIKDNGDVYV